MKAKGYFLIEILLSIGLLLLIVALMLPTLGSLVKQQDHSVLRYEMLKCAESTMEKEIAATYSDKSISQYTKEKGKFTITVKAEDFGEDLIKILVKVNLKDDENVKVEFQEVLSKKGIHFN